MHTVNQPTFVMLNYLLRCHIPTGKMPTDQDAVLFIDKTDYL